MSAVPPRADILGIESHHVIQRQPLRSENWRFRPVSNSHQLRKQALNARVERALRRPPTFNNTKQMTGKNYHLLRLSNITDRDGSMRVAILVRPYRADKKVR